MKYNLIGGHTSPEPPSNFLLAQSLPHNFNNNIPVFKSLTLITLVISDNVWQKIIKLSKTFDRKIFFRICTMQQEHGFSRWC